MALFFPGQTPCVLCGQLIQRSEDAIAFPAFLPKQHRFHRFSDAVFHIQCYQHWVDRAEFDEVYRKYRDIWESRPRELKTTDEIDAWGREAFKNFFLLEDPDKEEQA